MGKDKSAAQEHHHDSHPMKDSAQDHIISFLPLLTLIKFNRCALN
jgi:hypothetical protein